jgi:hypothetical protein
MNERAATMVSSIKIMAATYGPADGLKTGTRDVAPFLRALLKAREEEQQHADAMQVEDGSSSPRGDTDEDREGLYIPLMDGNSMNAVFGDVRRNDGKNMSAIFSCAFYRCQHLSFSF